MPPSALNTDNNWFKQLFESSPDPTWIIDGNRFVECNEAAIRALGYVSREEFLNVHPAKLSPTRQPDGEDSFAKAERMMAMAKGQGLHRFEWTHTKADGSNFVAEVTLSLIELEDRSVFYCVWRDISERKQAAAIILQERDFTHAVLGSLPGLFYLIDEQGRFLRWNQNLEHVSGYCAEEISTMSPLDIFGEADKASIASAISQVFEQGEVLVEAALLAKDGTTTPHFFTGKRCILEQKTCLIGMGVDITDRKQAEMALQESEARFRKVVDQSPFSMAIVSMDGSIEYINRKAIETFGYLPHDIPNMDRWWVKAYPDETYRADVMAQWMGLVEAALAHNHEIEEREYLVTCKNGDVKTVAIFGVWVSNQVLVIFDDVTERKRSETDLLAAKSAAETANQAKSRFLAAASHDLRQPLSALALYFDVLKNRVPSDSSELVNHIQACVDSLTGLLSGLLDVSKLEAGAVKVKLADVALDDLIASLVSVVSADARQQGLQFRLRHNVRCSGMFVRTDPHLFKRILGNIIVNAICYTHQGGVLIACRRHQCKQWIEVWDTGIGIPAHQTDIIFEEFRQLGDSARNRGSGLGLAIVARTAALLGLEIRVRSRPDRGSMFAVELPPERASVADTSQMEATPAQTRFLRIGLVDDNPAVLRALTIALKSLGHEVVAASCGRSLIESLGERAPDMVISDYRLAEGETGFGVITAARDYFGENLPAFLITGDTDPAVVHSMAERGIEVLFKPLQVTALQAAIGKATARRRGS